MAGHSHFANIKRKKDANDAKKAKLYTMLAREVRIAAGTDPNPDSNSKLKNAIIKAKSMGLPKENIERAIKSFDKSSEVFENIIYEAYWNNIAIIISAQTNNRLRTGPEIRNVLTKSSASVADIGSASFLFDNLGIILIKKNKIKINFKDLEEYAILECEADSCSEINQEQEDSGETSDLICIYSSIENYHSVLEKITEYLSKNCISDDFIEDSFIGYNSHSKIKIEDSEKLESFTKLIHNLEDLDDVINVFHNAE
jgi:YebC/PmpR family DNA-binding regulatory protein